MNSDQIGSLVRSVILTLGAGLATSGYISQENFVALAGAIGVLASVAWSQYVHSAK